MSTAIYDEATFCYTILHQTYESYLQSSSRYERIFAQCWYAVYSLKQDFISTPKDERATYITRLLEDRGYRVTSPSLDQLIEESKRLTIEKRELASTETNGVYAEQA